MIGTTISVTKFIAELMDLLRGYMIVITHEGCLNFLLDTIHIHQVFLSGLANIISIVVALNKDTYKPLLELISVLIIIRNLLGIWELLILEEDEVLLIHLTIPPPPPQEKFETRMYQIDLYLFLWVTLI